MDFTTELENAWAAIDPAEIADLMAGKMEVERAKLSLNIWVDWWPIPSRMLEYHIRKTINEATTADEIKDAVQKIKEYAPPLCSDIRSQTQYILAQI